MPSKHFAMDTGSEAGMTGFSCLLNIFGSSILAIQIAPPNITNLDNFIPDVVGHRAGMTARDGGNAIGL